MKNILFPTDLSIRSLSYLHNLAEQLDGPVNIILMHAQKMPESILEYWSFTRGQKHAQIPEEFREACEVMRNRYANTIQHLQIEFFYGTTRSALRNFLHAHQIDSIALPEQLNYHHAGKNSYNPDALLRRVKVPVMHVARATQREVITAPASISALLVPQH